MHVCKQDTRNVHYPSIPQCCEIVSFERADTLRENICKHTYNVTMHLTHTLSHTRPSHSYFLRRHLKAERLDVYLWLSVLSTLCECVRGLYMSKLPPTPAMTRNPSQCPHSPDWKAPSAAGASSLYDASRDGIQRGALLPGNRGSGRKSQQRRWWEKERGLKERTAR